MFKETPLYSLSPFKVVLQCETLKGAGSEKSSVANNLVY